MFFIFAIEDISISRLRQPEPHVKRCILSCLFFLDTIYDRIQLVFFNICIPVYFEIYTSTVGIMIREPQVSSVSSCVRKIMRGRSIVRWLSEEASTRAGGRSVNESRWQECQREQSGWLSTRAKWLAVNGNSWRSIYGRNGRFLIFFTYLCIETGESCIIHTPY